MYAAPIEVEEVNPIFCDRKSSNELPIGLLDEYLPVSLVGEPC
jgi:hypothetical protein